MKKITISKVNGVGAIKVRDHYELPRFVLERNVLDMLEDNDKYMNLNFCDAQIITEEATYFELFKIYTEEMTEGEFKEVYERIFK